MKFFLPKIYVKPLFFLRPFSAMSFFREVFIYHVHITIGLPLDIEGLLTGCIFYHGLFTGCIIY